MRKGDFDFFHYNLNQYEWQLLRLSHKGHYMELDMDVNRCRHKNSFVRKSPINNFVWFRLT
jgi:hypothetical protein